MPALPNKVDCNVGQSMQCWEIMLPLYKLLHKLLKSHMMTMAEEPMDFYHSLNNLTPSVD